MLKAKLQQSFTFDAQNMSLFSNICISHAPIILENRKKQLLEKSSKYNQNNLYSIYKAVTSLERIFELDPSNNEAKNIAKCIDNILDRHGDKFYNWLTINKDGFSDEINSIEENLYDSLFKKIDKHIFSDEKLYMLSSSSTPQRSNYQKFFEIGKYNLCLLDAISEQCYNPDPGDFILRVRTCNSGLGSKKGRILK